MSAATPPPVFGTPEEAEAAFYEALELGDLERLMQAWADDEEIVCIHPGGDRLVGLHAVRGSWQDILSQGVLPIHPVRTHTIHSLMSAVHTLVEKLTLEAGEGGDTHTIFCYTTNVFHKGPRGWKLVLHHSSQAPDDSELLHAHDYPAVLH